MKLYVSAALICLLSFSCQRGTDDGKTTKLSIQMPSTNSLEAKNIAYSTAAPDVSALSEWSTVTPTGLSSFNCFMVAISGPETLLNRNSCGQKAAAGTAITPLFSFGPVVGAVSAGQALDLEVASGQDRVIMVFGFQALTAAACQDYTSAGFDQSNLSKPYVLGRSTKVNLKPSLPNEYTTVSVPLTFDANAWFDDCSGPEFDQNKQNRIATMAVVRKNSFPQNTLIANTVCNPIEIELKDSSNRTAVANTNTVIGLKMSTAAGGVSPTMLQTSATYTDCVGSSVLTPTFTIPAGQSTVQRWISSPSSVTTASLSLDLSATNLLPDPNYPILTLSNMPSGNYQLEMTGPMSVIANTCYQYEVATRFLNGNYASSDTTTVTIQAPLEATLYASGDCTGALANSLSASNKTYAVSMDSSNSYKKLYVQYAAAEKNLSYNLSSSGSAAPAYFGSYISNTGDVIKRLFIREDGNLPDVYKCYGPFHLALMNDYGAEVKTLTSKTIMVSGVPAGLYLRQNSCAGSSFASTTTIAAGATSSVFYVDYFGAASGDHTVNFTESGTGLSFDLKLNIH